MYVPRPTVAMKTYASLTPQTYEEGLAEAETVMPGAGGVERGLGGGRGGRGGVVAADLAAVGAVGPAAAAISGRGGPAIPSADIAMQGGGYADGFRAGRAVDREPRRW